MLRENLRLIIKNKLTIIVLIAIIIINLGYTFMDIFNCYRMHNADSHEIISYVYLYDKPYAASSWYEFFSKFSAFLFLLIPISMSFLFVRNKNLNSICELRGKNLKQTIIFSISISLIVAVLFFLNYLLSMSRFYFSMGFKIEPWKIDYHNG